MVPSLKDIDPVTGEKVTVFEGTACLQYLAERFDSEALWTGRTVKEKGDVLSWTAYQTAGIGYVLASNLSFHLVCICKSFRKAHDGIKERQERNLIGEFG